MSVHKKRHRQAKITKRAAFPVGVAAGSLAASAFLPIAMAFADVANDSTGLTGDATPLSDLFSSLGPGGLDSGPLGNGSITPMSSLGDTGSPMLSGDSGAAPGGAPASSGGDTGGSPDVTPTGDGGSGSLGEGGDQPFTLGNYTFDPVQPDGSAGFAPVHTVFSAPPFIQAGEGDQIFNLTGARGADTTGGNGADPTGASGADTTGGNGADATGGSGGDVTPLGSINTHEDVSELFGGIHNTEFTVTGVNPADGVDPSQLPALGSVYDVANFGHGFENIYIDTPGADGGGGSITDTLVTPEGNFNIPTSFDAIGGLNAGNALSGVDVSSVGSGTGADIGAGGQGDDGGTGGSDATGGGVDAGNGATDATGGTSDLGSSVTDTGGGTSDLGNLADALGGAGAGDLGGLTTAAGDGTDALGGLGDATTGVSDMVDPLASLGL